MTDTQLYFSVGIPTFAILIGILVNVLQLHSINARFSSIDARFSSLEASINARFSSIDSRFNSLEASMNARFTAIEARLHSLETRFDTMLEKLVDMDNRISRLENRR